jgi:hypothetical protein
MEWLKLLTKNLLNMKKSFQKTEGDYNSFRGDLANEYCTCEKATFYEIDACSRDMFHMNGCGKKMQPRRDRTTQDLINEHIEKGESKEDFELRKRLHSGITDEIVKSMKADYEKVAKEMEEDLIQKTSDLMRPEFEIKFSDESSEDNSLIGKIAKKEIDDYLKRWNDLYSELDKRNPFFIG